MVGARPIPCVMVSMRCSRSGGALSPQEVMVGSSPESKPAATTVKHDLPEATAWP